ncbi:cytochrome P450 [Phenylobacterium sp.]|uniref:cytochrome P450 n=1 Tax=Phenylobacterium sp. TaxID=1871053 RepID=UPI00301DD9C6
MQIDIATYDPRIPLADPYPTYHALRAQAPVHWAAPAGVWVVSSHRLMREIMSDDETYGQAYVRREVSRHGEAVHDQPYFQMFRRMFFMMDGEDHRRLRPLFARWFMGPTRTRELTPMVERMVGQVLDELSDRESFDVIQDYAHQVPLRVISEILGVPQADSRHIAHDIEDIAPVVESVPKDAEVKRRADRAIVQLQDYFRGLVESRRRNMGDDLLSAMIQAGDAGGFADEEELLANVLLMYFAGHETTTAALGLAVLALHRNPDQLALLKRSPEIMPTAVDELMRYDGTAQGFSRSSDCDVVVGGHTIPAGAFILLLIGAGNRDPDVFADPDRLDLMRAPRDTLSFGGGAHVCIGNMLARQELRIGLAALLERRPDLRLDTVDPPISDFKPSLTRALTTLKARG